MALDPLGLSTSVISRLYSPLLFYWTHRRRYLSGHERFAQSQHIFVPHWTSHHLGLNPPFFNAPQVLKLQH